MCVRVCVFMCACVTAGAIEGCISKLWVCVRTNYRPMAVVRSVTAGTFEGRMFKLHVCVCVCVCACACVGGGARYQAAGVFRVVWGTVPVTYNKVHPTLSWVGAGGEA